MSYMLATAIGRLRLVGMIEGVSFLLLLGVAMPLKYLAGIEVAVFIAGWAHGALFSLFVVVLIAAAHVSGWSLTRTALVFLAAVIPFGPFLIDRRLAREDAAAR